MFASCWNHANVVSLKVQFYLPRCWDCISLRKGNAKNRSREGVMWKTDSRLESILSRRTTVRGFHVGQTRVSGFLTLQPPHPSTQLHMGVPQPAPQWIFQNIWGEQSLKLWFCARRRRVSVTLHPIRHPGCFACSSCLIGAAWTLNIE